MTEGLLLIKYSESESENTSNEYPGEPQKCGNYLVASQPLKYANICARFVSAYVSSQLYLVALNW